MMKKPWLRRILITLGVFVVIILVANIGLNIWLKNKLPEYVKKNTAYKISYQTLDVEFITGNILATGITVNNKNPQNRNVIGLQGTIDTLKVSRFGIFDALFNKTISSSDLLLAKPTLNIILAQPIDKKTGKKRNPVNFENIRINNGAIQVFKHNRQKFVAVRNLNFYVENLQMTEESVENKLPVVFDRYNISGDNFYIQPNNVYELKIANITTQDGQMELKNFQMKPIMSFEDFKKAQPAQKQMLEFAIPRLSFKDIVLKKNKVSLANAIIQNPVFKIFKTGSFGVKKKENNQNFELDLANVSLNNAKVEILKQDESDFFLADDLNVNINKLQFTKESSKEVIPFLYSDFKVLGKGIHYDDKQKYYAESISLNPKGGQVKNISSTSSEGTNFKTSSIVFNINEFGFVDKKMNLKVNDVLIDGINGKIVTKNNSNKKKEPIKGIQFPITVEKLSVKNSNVTYENNNQPLSLNALNATINQIELIENRRKDGIALKVKDYMLSTQNSSYKTKFYSMNFASLDLNPNKIDIKQFAMLPLVSRSQFIKMIPVESDLYDIKVSQITAQGKWDLFSENKFIDANRVVVNSANANIFRSKIPADDPKIKPLYSKMLRSIKIPMYIHTLQLKNSFLEYEEDTPKSSGPGKLTFTNFNMNVNHLNSAKMKQKPMKVQIKIDCDFMKASPLSVNWGFDTVDQSDRFTIAGKLSNIPATSLNSFVVPYLSVSATGKIQEMLFNFKGNPEGIGGDFKMKHRDLKISILDKETKEKKGFLTTVANLFIKSDSEKFPESVTIEGVERDPTKSFFNMFWKGIEDGLKSTLLGIDINKTKKTVESASNTVKEAKNGINNSKENVSSTLSTSKPEKKKPEEKKKKGLLNRVFKKEKSPDEK